MRKMTDNVEQFVSFTQYDIPPLKSGDYTITATQTANQQAFTASKRFAVPGNRFRLNGDDIISVLPAPLANGEFAGVMPLVALKRTTLPWQRTSVKADETAPWLAILVFMEGDQPILQKGDATCVFPQETPITVDNNPAVTGTGTMPAHYQSYPNINPLEYGQTPSDPCAFIDLPVDVFSKACPSAADLPYLAHIRTTDTYDSADNDETSISCAIVLGNRWPQPDNIHPDVNAYAYLVSLENMGEYLPDDSGNPSPKLLSGTTMVRLICYRTWRFAANDLAEKFKDLCENLNHNPAVSGCLATLRLPADAPDSNQVTTALNNQKSGQLTDADADTLVRNGLCLGYTALDHHLREAGRTVTWCRGPLVPFKVSPMSYSSVSSPDALLRYDPQTGLFDASYAQAWQLGQLLALQSSSFSVSLYNWKHSLQKGAAAQQEMALIRQKLGGADLFSAFFARRSARLDQMPAVPAEIGDWIGRLKLLKGVPFSALVPDERMLPVESLRFFYLDPSWIDAIVDGAFSIGRGGTPGQSNEIEALARGHQAAQLSARRQRKNQRPHVAARLEAAGQQDLGIVTGCLLRSQLVSGWPLLKINGYSDTGGVNDLTPLRIERLSDEVLICLFAGELKRLDLHEPPAQLHCGAEWDGQQYTATLRYLTGDSLGQQIQGGVIPVKIRPDGQTLQAADTANAIQAGLTSHDQTVDKFTSAEFAVEMVQGAVRVEFQVQ
ncbi:hypothetical protein R69746_07232 [Paraburkholderia aspalathi]|uniref:hypothetical protein n=1 Tax=Paraburkholderia aspalathi TaxID=1324617 RepID=UPI00190D9F01|nr:hypothetical protein [Paraburkholderia aspalathi]MBK3843209.1 hypothetical protein [Paraburkholderia aspalathi]CAE6848267.1 hypothetical protein R69746_07232 [Paraburkholderia aspalathi]